MIYTLYVNNLFNIHKPNILQTLKAFLPEMLSKNHGHIVSIASGAGFFGLPGQLDYAARYHYILALQHSIFCMVIFPVLSIVFCFFLYSKFGAVGLTEALYNELYHSHKTGVKVTCICPYYINTGMFAGVKSKYVDVMSTILL